MCINLESERKLDTLPEERLLPQNSDTLTSAHNTKIMGNNMENSKDFKTPIVAIGGGTEDDAYKRVYPDRKQLRISKANTTTANLTPAAHTGRHTLESRIK